MIGLNKLLIKKSINKIVIFFISFSLFFSLAQAEVIKEIKIFGNKRISEETIKIYGDINLNKDYSEKGLNDIIRKVYSTNFFENVEAKIENNILELRLKEYPAINQLIIIGEKKSSFRDQVKKIISSKQKGSFIKSNIAKDIEKIKSLYSSIGYNSSIIDIKIKNINDENLDLIIDISRGEQTTIATINFIGNKKIRDRRLRDIIASQEDKFWKVLSRNTKFSERLINLDIRLLKNYYKSLGYYDVDISSNSAEMNRSGNIDLIYSIEAGKRYIINKISTNADSTFDTELFLPLNKIFKKHIGEYYSPFKIKKILDELDGIIEINNLQFVEHNVQETIQQDGTISVVLNVFEGEKVLVERINITGNSITNENVIRSELTIDEGDPYTKLSLDKSISRIKSRKIFRDVKFEVKDGQNKGLKIINISVEEQPTGEISAGAGIGTNGGSVAFVIKENNWLGEGKSIEFSADIDAESLKGTLSYNDPNYDFLGNSLSYFVSSQSNEKVDQGYENTIFTTGALTSFEQYKNIRASLGLSASYDDLKTQSTASDALKKQAGTFTDLSTSYGFSYDLRNRTFKPTDGSIVSFGQSLPIYADKPSITNDFSASFYKTLTEDVVSSTRFLLTAVNGLSDEDVRLSNRRGLSQNRLRGFEKNKVGPVDDKDHVGGNYAASLNLEASLPNLLPESSKTDVGLFLDFGNVWGVDYDNSIDDSNKIRSTIGVGASWLSPIGPMTFTFSQNLSKASTDVTETFNFSLGTTF